MNNLKSNRERLGFTQKSLAEKTGLSLRTIQRLEAGKNVPKGHTLQVLTKSLNMAPADLTDDSSNSPIAEKEILHITFLNLSILLILIVPFGNLIFPILLWRKKSNWPLVDEMGRKIINLQIIWTVLFLFSLCIAPFIDNRSAGSFPLILIVLFVAIVINIMIVGYTAISIRRSDFNILNLPIKLL